MIHLLLEIFVWGLMSAMALFILRCVIWGTIEEQKQQQEQSPEEIEIVIDWR
jgi:hypothetical protein